MKRPRPMSEIINDLNKAQAVSHRGSCRISFLSGVLVGVIIGFTSLAILVYSTI